MWGLISKLLSWDILIAASELSPIFWIQRSLLEQYGSVFMTIIQGTFKFDLKLSSFERATRNEVYFGMVL